MKRKDIIGLVFAFGLLAIVGYFAYNMEFAKKGAATASAGTPVEVATALNDKLDPNDTLDAIDAMKLQNYKVTINLSTGLGNSTLFGQ